MLRPIWVLALLVSTIAASAGQDLELDRGAVGTHLRLQELTNPHSVLHVVAHPDDEDGAMLAWSARGLGARTMLFSITRGEGGANMISSHFFDELGALRTLEHAKAAGYYGIELFYSRAADYGYSKTLDEAMKQWQNGLPILEDLVEVIRRERPTVLLSRFAGDPRDGHGHHQMAGVVSRLAFDAAADPQQFTEQMERGLEPWQVKKLYVRAGSPWREPTEGEWTIALPTGTYDPVVGRTYAQIARFGLGFQRSQGISGHDGDPGPRNSYYRLVKVAGGGELPDSESSLFDGLSSRESSEMQRRERLRAIHQKWSPANPDSTVRALVDELAGLQNDPLSLPIRRKLSETIAVAAGIQFDAWATDQDGNQINHATRGEPLRIHVRVANPSAFEIHVEELSVDCGGTRHSVKLPMKVISPSSVVEAHIDVEVDDVASTRPHWNRPSIERPLYVHKPNGRQQAFPDAPFVAHLATIANGEVSNRLPIQLQSTVMTRIRHPEWGRVAYPLTVVPPMSVRFLQAKGVAAKSSGNYRLPVVVRNSRKGKSSGIVKLDLPKGMTCDPLSYVVDFEREDEERTVNFTLNLDQAPDLIPVRAIVRTGGEEIDDGFETVSARDLGRLNVYHKAVHLLELADVHVAGTPVVGYIEGSGDEVASSLTTLGITPTILSEADLASGDLSQFDVMVVGVRAYAVRKDIRVHNARLLEYVKQGGLLIVQYQTPEFDENFGPYPYSMGRRPEEVSEEDSVVTILEPDHPVFTTPNRISTTDFDDWFEQRGSKFWRTWDARYVPLLECHDTGQPPQRGGMLIASYGKGHYIYSAYAWYRQLPHGVPGAYRLFANLLSLPTTIQ